MPTASLNRSSQLDGYDDIDPEQPDAGVTDSEGRAESVHDTNDMDNDGEFGDDFDDFEEGGEGDDFGDFDDGFQQGEERVESSFDRPPEHTSVPVPPPGPVSRNHSIQSLLRFHDELFAVQLRRLTWCSACPGFRRAHHTGRCNTCCPALH